MKNCRYEACKVYTEEDGMYLSDISLFVTGKITGRYNVIDVPAIDYINDNGDGDPGEYDEELIDFEIDNIICYDDDGEVVYYELSPDEDKQFEHYMLNRLEEEGVMV